MFRRYGLFDDFDNIFRGFDNMFRLSLGDPSARQLPAPGDSAETARPSWYPAVETFTRKNDIVLRAELPGVDPKDVEVTVEDGRLILRGEKREEKLSDGDNVYMREVRYGRFERSFTLPKGAKSEQVSATFRNGVLEVSLPAEAVTPPARRVPVKIGKEKRIKAA